MVWSCSLLEDGENSSRKKRGAQTLNKNYKNVVVWDIVTSNFLILNWKINSYVRSNSVPNL